MLLKSFFNAKMALGAAGVQIGANFFCLPILRLNAVSRLRVQSINLRLLAAGNPVRVHVQGHFDRRMTQLLCHVQKVVAFHEPQGSLGVSKIVNPDVRSRVRHMG